MLCTDKSAQLLSLLAHSLLVTICFQRCLHMQHIEFCSTFGRNIRRKERPAEEQHEAANKRDLMHTTFLQAAVHVFLTTHATSRKATANAATLHLMRAAKHHQGKPAKRRAARATLHEVMKHALSSTKHTNMFTISQTSHSPSLQKIPIS